MCVSRFSRFERALGSLVKTWGAGRGLNLLLKTSIRTWSISHLSSRDGRYYREVVLSGSKHRSLPSL